MRDIVPLIICMAALLFVMRKHNNDFWSGAFILGLGIGCAALLRLYVWPA